MYQLLDLQKVLESNGVEIAEFGGWFVKQKNGDMWTLAFNVFYKNGKPVNEKDLPKLKKK